MRHVSLREANQRLSACIAEVEHGQHIIVERRGVPVAEIIPYRKPLVDPAKRKKELKNLFALLDKGLPLGGAKAPSKDEMHEH